MEIERKFLVREELLPDLSRFCKKHIIQGYLCTNPVVRIRKSNNSYELTYKGKGLLAREEHNMPLTEEGFYHLLKKIDGNSIEKNRYIIPIENGLKIELDIFEGKQKGLILAEVEFSSIDEAKSFIPPLWFTKDVTMDEKYHNSNMI